MTDDGAQLSPPRWESLRKLPLYYSKAGLPIFDVLEWARLFEDPTYKHILSTDIFASSDAEGPLLHVLTIWDGIDPDYPFLRSFEEMEIFHTGIFCGSRWSETFKRDFPIMRREFGWRTLEDAWRGHFAIVSECEGEMPGSFSRMDWRHHPRIAAMEGSGMVSHG